MEPVEGFEPTTFTLQKCCSTPELHRRMILLSLIDWWAGKDSNLRRREPSDLQSDLVDRLSTDPGAVVGARTRDLILTMDMLCQLSYDGLSAEIITDITRFVKTCHLWYSSSKYTPLLTPEIVLRIPESSGFLD